MTKTIAAIGDGVIRIHFPGEVNHEMNFRIQSNCELIHKEHINGVLELVPGYHTITLYYDPYQIRFQELEYKLKNILENDVSPKKVQKQGRLLRIPVCYGGELGPDLSRVAKQHHLTEEEVIKRHQQPEYLVYLLGFLPGFPYLGGLDQSIATSRLEEPRTKTIAGSVGIADAQTGIYPLTSPGGWNIIGNSPIPLFDAEKKGDAFLIHPGDRVKFYEISEANYSEFMLRKEAPDSIWEEVIMHETYD